MIGYNILVPELTLLFILSVAKYEHGDGA